MDTNLGQVVLVKDINPTTNYYGSNSDSYPSYLTKFDDKLYFSAEDGENGRELWVSDGTAAGTQLVLDVQPGDTNYGEPDSSFPREFFEFNDKLYFSADVEESGRELWVSDGTTGGTQLLIEIDPTDANAGTQFAFPDSSYPGSFAEFNDKLYFSADDGENGRELWVSDGTADGTQLLVDIQPGARSFDTGVGIFSEPYSSNPSNLIEFNNKLYFAADGGESGNELWVSDGTEEGTQLLVDISPDVNISYQYDYLDGSNPRYIVEFQDKLYFSANDDVAGRELWVSDGTAGGTQLLVDINPGSNSYRYGFGGDYSYSDYPARSNPREFVEFQDKLYFSARNNESGRELWVTDGTAEGTQLVADINPGTDGSAPIDLVEFNDKLYFAAEDGENGRELWVSDGTEEGTQLVADIKSEFTNSYGSGYDNSSDPSDLTVVGNELFFSADNGETGFELFKLTAEDLTEEMPIAIDGTDCSDNLHGSDSSERIHALSGRDTVDSGAGDDTIDGGDGSDRLTGGEGHDFLDGGLGHDTLQGDSGDDTFVLRTGAGTDTIIDFHLGSDRLGLSDGLHFCDLSFSGHTILVGEEVLATLNGVDTTHLSASDFTPV